MSLLTRYSILLTTNDTPNDDRNYSFYRHEGTREAIDDEYTKPLSAELHSSSHTFAYDMNYRNTGMPLLKGSLSEAHVDIARMISKMRWCSHSSHSHELSVLSFYYLQHENKGRPYIIVRLQHVNNWVSKNVWRYKENLRCADDGVAIVKCICVLHHTPNSVPIRCSCH